MIKPVLASALLAGLALASVAHAAGNAVAGRTKAFMCMGCHGIPGWTNPYPNYRVPKLGGQHAQYIVAALEDYKSGARKHATMEGQAASLSTQDMQDIAAFLAEAPHNGREVQSVQTHFKQMPAKAKICAACHGPDGHSKIPMYPDLGGQYENYLEQALLDYKSGKRKNPIMNAQASTLTKADIKELAEWFASRKPVLYTPSITAPFKPKATE